MLQTSLILIIRILYRRWLLMPQALLTNTLRLTDAQQYADSEDVPTLQAYVTTLTAALNS